MNANTSLSSHAVKAFKDELDEHIAESLLDPEYRAASIDVDRRIRLIETLVSLRNKLGLNQTQVAERMGVGQSTISGFETEASDPRLSTIQRYARAVEAECRWVVMPVLNCDWILQPNTYDPETEESTLNVKVDSSDLSQGKAAWAAARTDFALAR